jgi:hypothetical protein
LGRLHREFQASLERKGKKELLIYLDYEFLSGLDA